MSKKISYNEKSEIATNAFKDIQFISDYSDDENEYNENILIFFKKLIASDNEVKYILYKYFHNFSKDNLKCPKCESKEFRFRFGAMISGDINKKEFYWQITLKENYIG